MNINKLGAGKNPQNGEINVVIEIPEGSLIKYEIDKESGVMMVDRFATTTMGYPTNYGFVPNTHADDGDALDVLVLTSQNMHPGTGIACRVVGMLEMEDEAGIDTKVIAVPTKKADPFMAHIDSIDDIEEITKKKIKHFFDHYKDLEEGKWVKTKGFLGTEQAIEEIKKSLT